MKKLCQRSLRATSLALAMITPAIHAQPILTGYDSSKTIPESLFEDTEQPIPWIKPQQREKKPLRPATPQNAQLEQQRKTLQQSLAEQQRINQALVADHQNEKLQLQEQLKKMASAQALVNEQSQQLAELQRLLSESQSQHGDAQQQLHTMRLELTAHQLLTDTQAVQQSVLSDKLKGKQQDVVALMQQIEAAKQETQALQKAAQPDATQLAELKQHQEKVRELQAALSDAEQQQSRLNAQLHSLQQRAKPENHQQKLAYANGVAFADNIVQSLRAQQNLGVEPDRPMVLAGIQDAFDKQIALNSEEVKKLVSELDQQLNEKLNVQQQKQQSAAARQKKLGHDYVEKFRQQKGVKKLEGALFKVVKSGKGARLTPESTVELLLSGKLPDGTLFDHSGIQNKVQRVKLNSLLPALTAVLSQQHNGSELQVVLPADHAFGSAGVENLIPGNATLIFDVKLINKK